MRKAKYKPKVFRLDRDKMKNLVLYILNRVKDCDLVKLSCLLYISDMESYRTLGAPITGASYRKMEFGPYPWGLKTILREMERDKSIQPHKTKTA